MLPRMNDMNTQMKMQIRSIISAPVLHPTIAPPPISACDLGAKLITIIDLQSEVAQLATNLANLVNGGSMDHFVLLKGSSTKSITMEKYIVDSKTGNSTGESS